jgi:dynein heavy chain
MENFSGGLENGAYIYGLFIEGCRFDFSRLRLMDSEPGIMFTKAPVI